MKNSKIIDENREAIEEKIKELYRDVLESSGRIEYDVYIWSDGEIETLLKAQGSNEFLRAKDSEERELIYVCNIDAPYFDPWDYADKPDDEAEAEEAEEEIIDELVAEFDAESIVDYAISEEKYREEIY